VAVGDRISVRHTLGQLEAMKIFTPLKLADFNGDVELYDGAGIRGDADQHEFGAAGKRWRPAVRREAGVMFGRR
jgi:hypothetical protein